MNHIKNDVTFIGNAIVDILAQTTDEILKKLKIQKGAMQLIDKETSDNLLKNIKYPKIIDNSSKISKSASIGKGSIVMANTFIGVKSRIRDFCILNTKASIDHESVMQDFSSLGPNVTTGGKVNIGLRSAICIGTTLKDKIKIQRDTVVGAGSYVNKNLNSNSVYYGNPIKFIRKRKFEDDYL